MIFGYTFGQVAKAFAGAAVALLGSLSLFITGGETLADVTQGEWINVAINVLATFGIVYRVPNKEL